MRNLKFVKFVMCSALALSTTQIVAETIIMNSKSSSSNVSSFEGAGRDRSSSNSAVVIDSRGQSGFASSNGGFASSSSSSFQGAASDSFKNDSAFRMKGASSSTSTQESSKIFGR
jgi:hypothetical protein